MDDNKRNTQVPRFSSYTKDHWSMLLYVETLCVDHGGKPDPRRMNEADRSAADEMKEDGLLQWLGTGLYPVFKMTDTGWSVAHAIRRHRADGGGADDRPSIAMKAWTDAILKAEPSRENDEQ